MAHDESLPDATIIIGMSSSRCNNCGENASPSEDSHDRVIGYGGGGPGCGITYTHVTSSYYGQDDVVAKMRPDLELIPVDGRITQ